MSVYKPTYTDKKTGKQKHTKTWYYEFIFAGRLVKESAKTTSKTVAKEAEKKRRRELEEGFNGIGDARDERVTPVRNCSRRPMPTTPSGNPNQRSLPSYRSFATLSASRRIAGSGHDG